MWISGGMQTVCLRIADGFIVDVARICGRRIMNEEETVFLSAAERTDRPRSLFFLYCAANIGILGLVYGAIIVGFQLSFLQAVLATVIGSFSFGIVGLMSLAGRDTGAVTFVLSRASFGFRGNLIPSVAALIGHAGWLSINVCTGALTVLALFATLGLDATPMTTGIALAIFVLLVLASVVFSHDMLIRMQTICTYLFGFFTLVILAIIIPQTDWAMLLAMPDGDWAANFLPALAFVAAGTGIGWTSYAADYSCHQAVKYSRSRVGWAVTLGGVVPLVLMLGVGILLSSKVPDLASSSNPIEVIKGVLPVNLAILYYITAIGGLTPQCFLGLKSSKLVLQAAHILVNERWILLFQTVVVTLIPAYILFVAQDFQGTLEGFLSIIGKLLAAWSSVFLMDYLLLRRTHGYDRVLLTDPVRNALNSRGVISWVVGFVVGMLFSQTFVFTGPFATGIFADNSLNVLLTLVVSGGLYSILVLVGDKRSAA